MKITDEMVEAAFQAYIASPPKDKFRAALTAALEGMVMVPEEPTEAMIRAGKDGRWRGDFTIQEIYRAMIRASQE